jgi:hypothetical protein
VVVRLAAIVGLVAASGCVDDRYRCTTDAQCDVGEAGRCEADQRCSYWDPGCSTGRHYAEHGGEVSDVCLDDRVVPADLCAEGQPPALEEGCIADVCAALPACCATGWSSACVQQAQLRCPDLRCDTRVAITATGATTELWDLRWDGATWSAAAQPPGDAVAWLAPAPGTAEPRLAHLGGGMLTAGAATVAYGDHVAQTAASVDLDRTGHDVVAITVAGNGQFVELAELSTGVVREQSFASAAASAWGDYDHDGFPDAVFGNANTNRVAFIGNVDAPDHTRALSEAAVTDLYGPATPGQTPQVRTLEWTDVTGDGVLDVLVGGIVVRAFRGETVVRDVALVTADCNPVVTSNHTACAGDTTFAAAGAPSVASGTVVWMATYPDRVLTTMTFNPTAVAAVPLPACTGCAPFVALVVRDLDGDHEMDVVAIDQDLGVWTVTVAGDATKVFTIPTTLADVTQIRTSISGAPIP